MAFTHPLYLWGLLGLLVPLAIHLWSKKEAKTIKVGSIALLKESTSKKSRSLQWNEWALLALRMLLVTGLVLLMAGPQMLGRKNQDKVAYFVEPSLNAQLGQALLDSLAQEAPVHLLQQGFPLWQPNGAVDMVFQTPHYWQWAKALEEFPADSLVLFTQGLQQGIRGKRPQVAKPMHWVVLEGEVEQTVPWQVQRNGDMARITKFRSSSAMGEFIVEQRPWKEVEPYLNPSGDSLMLPWQGGQRSVPLVGDTPLKIGLYANTDFENEQKYIKSAFTALAKFWQRELLIIPMAEGDSVESDVDLLVWLAQAPSPTFQGPRLVFKEDALADDLIAAGPSPRVFHLTARLDAERATQARLPEQLARLVYPTDQLHAQIAEYDQRNVPLETLRPRPKAPQEKVRQQAGQALSLWVWGALVVLFLAERTLAHIRKQ